MKRGDRAVALDVQKPLRPGGDGFLGTVTKPDAVTFIAGTVKDRRVYRVHTQAPPKRAEEARKVHEEFLKTFRPGRQS